MGYDNPLAAAQGPQEAQLILIQKLIINQKGGTPFLDSKRHQVLNLPAREIGVPLMVQTLMHITHILKVLENTMRIYGTIFIVR